MSAQPNRPPLLRDIIDIPEPGGISDSDFVFKLVETLDDPAEKRKMLTEYVITERLVENYDQTLSLIQSAVGNRTSKAAYLHGSFGSGKSHFMGVLYSILQGDPEARGRDEFAKLIDRHEPLLEAGKNFLLVPYHMTGAKSLEQRVLGGYVKRIKKLHPHAAAPMVYRTDALFENIRRTRANVGDEVFIAKLGTDATAADPTAGQNKWGDVFAWTPELLDIAMGAEQASEEDKLDLTNPKTPTELRTKLTHDALSGWFPGFFGNAQEDEYGFIALDSGLSVIAEHAKSLGYDALILFLDELILWLANGVQDPAFVARESGKISNFVEGGDVRRAIPVVSFISRQRDMRELVGEGISGVAETAIQDTLTLSSGRFDMITLEDRNLPVIAKRRLLTPDTDPDGSKARQLHDAFQATLRVRQEIRDIMLGSAESTTGSDEASFELSYPFSPAFMDTVVQVSNSLQRSRTGLKLMRQLLIDHRDDLRVGQVVPIGDLYKVISSGGDEPFTDRLKAEYKEAQRLYVNKLRPYLLEDTGITEEDVELVRHHPERASNDQRSRVETFIGFDRLMATLLLSALAPSVSALNNMTVRRLAFLNHGSIKSPIPGGEIGTIIRKTEDWAARFTEIKLVKGDDPGISLELIGVDVDSVITGAKPSAASHAPALLKRLIKEEFFIAERVVDGIDLTWKGSRRSLEAVVVDVSDELNRAGSFAPIEEGQWRLVIDLPINHYGRGPHDSHSRAEKIKREGMPERTIFWIPAHFTSERREEFARLNVIDFVLHDRRFDTHAGHLNADDRQRAKTALEEQHRILLQKFRERLKQAYGVNSKLSSEVTPFDTHIVSMADVEPKLPFGEPLATAARGIADQLLSSQFPGHPDLTNRDHPEDAVRPAEIRTVFGYIRKAVENGTNIVEVDRRDRALMARLGDGLRIGTMHEARFELKQHWVEHFNRLSKTQNAPEDIPYSMLVSWIDDPKPWGLDTPVANLILSTYAEQTNRVWVLYGSPVTPEPEADKIRSDYALHAQPLPTAEVWAEAVQRAADVYGVQAPPLRSGRLVSEFARDLLAKVREYADAVNELPNLLKTHAEELGLDPRAQSGRLHTALLAADLGEALTRLASPDRAVDLINHLASADFGGPNKRMGRSIRSASVVSRAVAGATWDFFKLLKSVPRAYAADAESISAALHSAARADELTLSLPEALARTRAEVTALLDRVNAERAVADEAAAAAAAAQQAGSGVSRDDDVPENPTIVPDQAAPGFPPPADTGGRRSAGRRQARAGQFRKTLEVISAEVAEFAEASPDAMVEISWRVVE